MLVTVYGTLRRGFGNYKNHLRRSQYVGTYDTKPIYTLKSLVDFPALLKGGSTSVVMEVFRINDETMKGLDRLEGYVEGGNNNLYEKEVINTPFGKAYVYFYSDTKSISKYPIIETGDWKEYFKNQKLYNHV